jgi:hypothetical protein
LRKGKENVRTLLRAIYLIQRMQNRELLSFSAQQRSSEPEREKPRSRHRNR